MNMQELTSESYNQKILLKNPGKMVLTFDQLPCPHKTVRNPTDHICIGNDYILWYKIQKIKKCVQVLGYALTLSALSKHTHFNYPLPFKRPFSVAF